jgi:CheY-like chemotaxis protein
MTDVVFPPFAYTTGRSVRALGLGAMDGDAAGPVSESSIDNAHGSEAHSVEAPVYSLLNDQPAVRIEEDLLGSAEIADGIASVVVSSRASSPFVLAIDADWGMGKSTLLHQIETRLTGHPSIVKVHFNAWTADGENVLEGLIKSVLEKLDGNIMRGRLRELAQHRRLMWIARLSSMLLGRFFGVARMVDEVWEQLKVDAKSRNEMRDLIQNMLSDWIKRDDTPGRERALVVFVDDLDRCSDEVVVKVCEAIKLYLDAPGLIFILACDQSVLARGVSASTAASAQPGRFYMEKIVQVVYRLPLPEERQIKELIGGYAKRSGTAALIDETVTEILARRTGRNPRRIKRIINSFVLEYRLDPGWRKPPLGSVQLVTAILLQHLYTPFYDLLRQEYGADPIVEFLDYVEVRAKAFNPADEEWWNNVRQTFQSHGLPAPSSDSELWNSQLEQLDGQLPEDFPKLARDDTFVALLRGVGDVNTRIALRAQLIRRPLATEFEEPGPVTSPEELLAGWHVVCVDDNPDSLFALVRLLEQSGVSVTVYDDPVAAELDISVKPPDAVISDITRGDDPDAGFEHIARLRSAGYQGPVVFFTGRVTPQRRRRATELRAVDVATAERAVIDALLRVAGEPDRNSRMG